MRRALIHLAKSEKASTAIEYALLAMLIAMLLILALSTIGTKLSAIFSSVSTSF